MRTFISILVLAAVAGCGGGSPSSPPNPPAGPYAIIETYMGTGAAGLGSDGLAPAATQLYLPQDVTFGPDGRPYVLDWNNHRVRVVDGGVVRTIIGTGELGDAPEGPAAQTRLNHPTHVAFDPQGRLVVSAWHNSKVMRMDPGTGMLELVCGNGQRAYGGDNGPARAARLDLPVATAFDALGRMYIADQANQRIRRIDENGIITTVVGTGIGGYSGDNGPAIQARIRNPGGPADQSAQPAGRICLDAQGNLYIADTGNQRIRRVDPGGIITTVAGNGFLGFAGDGGPATAASLSLPSDIGIDSHGNLYIADTHNSCIRKVDTNGVITTFAGRGGQIGSGGDGGPPGEATLNRPYGVCVDAQDNVYIADTHNHRVRVVRR